MINGFDIEICGAKKNMSDSFQAESVIERKKTNHKLVFFFHAISECLRYRNGYGNDSDSATVAMGCENRWDETCSMIFVKFEVLSKSE